MEEKSLLELAIKNMAGKKTPQNIYKFLDEVLSLKGIAEGDENYVDAKAQLYTDMITSAQFVYCGDDSWNLKDNESLELWDKDASYFNKDVIDEEEEEVIDDNGVTVDDYNIGDSDDDDDDNNDEDSNESEYDHYDDEDDDDDDYDEKEYNDVMDDYEDLYDEK